MRFPLVALAALMLAGCQAATATLDKPVSAAVNYGGERTSFGVSPRNGPFEGPVSLPTPTSAPGVRTITTAQAQALALDGDAAVFDVWDSSPGTFPGAVRASYLGVPKTDAAGEAAIRRRFLAEFGGLRSTPTIFLCAGVNCRESYNAAMRAKQAGFTKVMWYRGGYAAWNQARAEQ
jgi:rhodanese-related sulfurtransferase